MLQKYPSNNIFSGFGYFVEGAKLIWHPRLRPFLIVPLAVNILLFFALSAVFIHYFEGLMASIMDFIPWLKHISGIVFFIVGVFFIIVYGYSFNLITNVVAAPFYGLLAEKAEEVITGNKLPPEPLSKMIPRVMARELQKLMYFVFRGLLVMLIIALIGFIPIINFIAPIIGLAWSAWCMSIQYVDYHADNHQTPFDELRKKLWKKPFSNLGLGGTIIGCSVIPVVNIFAMPAAVVAGTIYWLNELQGCEVKKASY